MQYIFSKRSINNLLGISPDLVRVAYGSLEVTRVDFIIVQGLRTIEEQMENIKNKRSQILDSKHIAGRAIDIAAYVDGTVSWESQFYIDIANAFSTAAKKFAIPIRWGGAWNILDISEWHGSMDSAHKHYVSECIRNGKKQFNDFGHFELN